MKNIILLVLFLFITVSIIAQDKVTEIDINSVTGEAVGSHSESVEQIKQKAINKAKEEALRKSGIEENINSYTDLFRSESSDSYEELFSSDVLTNIRGSVKNVEVLESNITHPSDGVTKVVVSIKCTVMRYNTRPDLTFEAKVEGVEHFYKEGDGLSFLITPTHNSYINAFMFTSESFVLLPNDYEPMKMLNVDEEIRFPSFPGDYELDAGGHEKEVNRLVLVLTKEKYKYHGKVNYKDITDWIMTIPPDEKLIKSYPFTVVKK